MTTHAYTLSQLHAAGRSVVVPCLLPLCDGRLLQIENILRLLPGKRVVARAVLDGRVVLAKIFFTREHWQREREAFARLHDKGIPTPALLEAIDEGTVGICVHEFLQDGYTLSSHWQQGDEMQRRNALQVMLDAQAALYDAGLLQTDLHPGNVMQCDERWYVLDPASCRELRNRADRDDNLALLLAQCPLTEWQLIMDVIAMRFAGVDRAVLQQRAREHWQQRKRKYLAKIFRDCSEVVDCSHRDIRILCRREALSDALCTALQQPDTLRARGVMLKDGNSAKVYRLALGNSEYVVKEYLDKDLWRKLRRALRRSRAAHSWRAAHLLRFAGIGTPQPIALVEQRHGLLDRRAWLLCEAVEGKDLLSHWVSNEPTVAELQAVKKVFDALSVAGITHGDMKATNWLCARQGPQLIDLDAMQDFDNASAAASGLLKDRERFFCNWQDKTLRERLQLLWQEGAA